jgi:hypothetical protein
MLNLCIVYRSTKIRVVLDGLRTIIFLSSLPAHLTLNAG